MTSREQKAQQVWGVEERKPRGEDKTWRPGGPREPDIVGDTAGLKLRVKEQPVAFPTLCPHTR